VENGNLVYPDDRRHFHHGYASVGLCYRCGAGANSRQALEMAVFSGMLSATLLMIFFVPAFYRLIQRGSESLSKRLKTK
jgi:Cu/Ag efflux pump CusA